MKRGWKIFWIVCACLAGLGFVLCIGGFVMGATFTGINRIFWKYGNRIEQTAEHFDYDDEYEDDYFDEAEEDEETNTAEAEGAWESSFSGNVTTVPDNFRASLQGIGELDVEVSYLLVEVQEGDGDAIVFLTNNIPSEVEDELILTQDGDELEVTIRNEKRWRRAMNHLGKPATLTIQIPKKHGLRSMSLAIGAGALEADEIRVDKLDVAVGAGEAVIHQFTVNTLDVKVGAGEADITGTITAEADIECGIGAVNYQAAGSREDYSYDLEVGAGVVSIENEEYSGLVNSKKIMNGGPLMKIQCGIGEVNVTF